MSRYARTTALVLTGAVGIASAGYAIGIGADDGSAVASGSSNAQERDRGPHFRLGGLAERLGVGEDALRDALEDLRPEGDPHEEMAQALADALNLDVDDVTAALERSHGDRHRDFAEDLAAALGVSEQKVRRALDARPHTPRALARRLGVTRAELRAALPRPRLHHGPDVSGLAEELGVTEQQLEDAFERIHDEKRAEFAQRLADRLDIDVDTVQDALDELGPGPHPHGRPGP
jgi:transcriptional regulator with XRE-family HTH domain